MGHKQYTLFTNDYHKVNSNIILNIGTFSRILRKKYWAQYPKYKNSFVNCSLHVINTHIFIVLTHS